MAIRQVTRAGVGLVVGIIILGVLVLGGMWLVRERGEQARREEAINIADQQLQAQSNEDIAIKPNDSNNAPVKQDEPAKTGQTDPSANSPVTATPPAAATELPQTGPGAISIVGIGLLSFAVASFVHSRKLV